MRQCSLCARVKNISRQPETDSEAIREYNSATSRAKWGNSRRAKNRWPAKSSDRARAQVGPPKAFQLSAPLRSAQACCCCCVYDVFVWVCIRAVRGSRTSALIRHALARQSLMCARVSWKKEERRCSLRFFAHSRALSTPSRLYRYILFCPSVSRGRARARVLLYNTVFTACRCQQCRPALEMSVISWVLN